MNAFAALSDNTRREIVKLIAQKGELTSTEISERFKMSAPAISQHLKVLKEAKILQVKKDAQKRLYSIDETGIEEVGDWLVEIKNLWNKRLDNLDKYLQKMKKERTHDKK
ncbi:MAG: ArsR/SmtB family transcription factor [Pseudobdellovibrionaceae bacterium]